MMLAVDELLLVTVRFVVIVLSHPFACGITVMYVPEAVSAEPPGGV
jgi:hypothetical protein